MMKSNKKAYRPGWVLVCCLAVTAAFVTGPRPVMAQDTAGLRLEPAAESALQEALARPLKKFALNQKGADEIAAAIQAWVGSCMDLAAAKPRPSRLYAGGVTYHLQAAKNVPIFLDGDEGKGEGGGPVEIFFRKSPHRFDFHKFSEVGATTKLDDSVLIDRASQFLQKNGFVRFSNADKWGDMKVTAMTTEEETGTDDALRQVFEVQRVKFRRYFEGLPVANSSIGVDFHPQSGEVLGLKHHHWSPVDEAFGADAPKQQLEDVRKNLVGKIRSKGISLERARVENIRACWFETLGDLVPALMCELVIDPPAGEEVQPVRIAEYINLAGSDDALRLKNTREIQGPPDNPPAEVK
jgi:hypothetical protein